MSADFDTDDDGIPDMVEDKNGDGCIDISETDPLLPDTDGDGMQDGYELDNTLNPRFDDGCDDFDGDGFSNFREFIAGSLAIDAFSIPAEISDFDLDSDVDASDLAVVITQYGRSNCVPGCPCCCDMDGNGIVDSTDLRIIAEDFGRQRP